MSKSSIKICDQVVHKGEIANLALPLPMFYSCAPMYMPIKVINGKKDGPNLLIVAAMRAAELNGVEIINEFIKGFDDTKELRGSITLVPVLNIYELTNLGSSAPRELDISEAFPGDSEGTFAQRLADIFTKELLSQADVCVQIKTGDLNHEILPQVYCDISNRDHRRLAYSFKTPVVTSVENKYYYSLRECADSMNIPFFVYEGGEAMRFDSASITTGIEGIENLLVLLDMKDGEAEGYKDHDRIVCEEQDWIRSPKGGILHSDINLGDSVKEGDMLGFITDPFGGDGDLKILSNSSGVVVGINRHPLLIEGVQVFKIAKFMNPQKAQDVIGSWEESRQES
jgi:predicted deacylase